MAIWGQGAGGRWIKQTATSMEQIDPGVRSAFRESEADPNPVDKPQRSASDDAYFKQQDLYGQINLANQQHQNEHLQGVADWAKGGYQGPPPGQTPYNDKAAPQEAPPPAAAPPPTTGPAAPPPVMGGGSSMQMPQKTAEGWDVSGAGALNPNLGKDISNRASMVALASLGRNPY